MTEPHLRHWLTENDDRMLSWGVIMDADAIVTEMINQKLLKDKTRILEVGFGYGRLLGSLLKIYPEKDWEFEYAGIDINQTRVDRAMANQPTYNFYCLDAGEDAIPNAGSYDIIISLTMFKHFYPDFGYLINHLKGVAPTIAFDIPLDHTFTHYKKLEINDAYIQRCYTDEEVRKISAMNGYVVEKDFPIVHYNGKVLTTCPPPIIRQMYVIHPKAGKKSGPTPPSEACL